MQSTRLNFPGEVLSNEFHCFRGRGNQWFTPTLSILVYAQELGLDQDTQDLPLILVNKEILEAVLGRRDSLFPI